MHARAHCELGDGSMGAVISGGCLPRASDWIVWLLPDGSRHHCLRTCLMLELSTQGSGRVDLLERLHSTIEYGTGGPVLSKTRGTFSKFVFAVS